MPIDHTLLTRLKAKMRSMNLLQMETALVLHFEGESYRNIAQEIGSKATTIFRFINAYNRLIARKNELDNEAEVIEGTTPYGDSTTDYSLWGPIIVGIIILLLMYWFVLRHN